MYKDVINKNLWKRCYNNNHGVVLELPSDDGQMWILSCDFLFCVVGLYFGSHANLWFGF